MAKDPKQDRTDAFDANVAANALFSSEGGMAVWVRRPELSARCAVRRGGDLVECVTEIASLVMGIGLIERALAQKHGVPIDDFIQMVRIAGEEMIPHTEHVARIKSIPPTGDQK